MIELVVVLIIIGIIATVGLKSLNSVNRTARYEDTKEELQCLARAIVGDPEKISGGARSDYGYVGDIGGLPPNLSALVTNPGGYGTWKGPYFTDPFSTDGSSGEYRRDAWGKNYSYSGGLTVTSVGGPQNITYRLAESIDDLLYNRLSIVVLDLAQNPPGTTYRDSVRVILYYPNGSGSTISLSSTPDNDGLVQFDSIPIGLHTLDIAYLPTADTIRRQVHIDPGRNIYFEANLTDAYFD